MALKTSLTGSYPPIKDPDIFDDSISLEQIEKDVREGIERAISDQQTIGIDYLVDGQVRNDIVSLFTCKIPGYDYCRSPNIITGKIHPAEGPIVTGDYEYARKWSRGKPLKAHLTGPMTLAHGSMIDPDAPYSMKNPRQLILDLAAVLAQEAKLLKKAGAEIIQIDEPALRSTKDMETALEAIQIIVDQGEISTSALHICGNITNILTEVLDKAPVAIVSIEGIWLTESRLDCVNGEYLTKRDKKLAIGCIQVANYTIDRLTKVQNFLDQIVDKIGEESIWAITPNCGMRSMPYEIAKEKINIMVQAARSL